MDPRQFSIEVIRRLNSAGHTAYWAGGCVRDLLRGVEPNDFDVATDATPEQVREIFGRKRTIPVGASFGVIIVLGPKTAGQVEVATFRREGEYTDGRRPETVEYCTPEEDAQRRDFTVNGMFYDPLKEEVHDFVGGQKDLKERIIRAIGDAHDRMTEDKLRLLRAVRFAAVLGFELDGSTAAAVKEMASQIVVVSAERITQEFKKMLVSPHRSRAMKMCEELELLEMILPEVVDQTVKFDQSRWLFLNQVLEQLRGPTFEMALAVLLQDVGRDLSEREEVARGPSPVVEICRRLKLSNHETEAVSWLVANSGKIDSWEEWSLAEKKEFLVETHAHELLKVEKTMAVIGEAPLTVFSEIDSFLNATPIEELDPPPLLDGRDLIELGYRPGPQFKDWLRQIRLAQLNGDLQTKAEASRRVEELAGG